MHARIAAFIEESGHSTTLEPVDGSDGHRFSVRFRTCGENFQVNVDLDDPYFLYVSVYYPLPNTAPSIDVLHRLMIEAQAAAKVVKFSLDGEYVVVDAEQYWAEPDGFNSLLWRSVRLMQHAAGDLFRRIRDATRPLPSAADAKIAADRFLAEFADVRFEEPDRREDPDPPDDGAMQPESQAVKRRGRRPNRPEI